MCRNGKYRALSTSRPSRSPKVDQAAAEFSTELREYMGGPMNDCDSGAALTDRLHNFESAKDLQVMGPCIQRFGPDIIDMSKYFTAILECHWYRSAGTCSKPYKNASLRYSWLEACIQNKN
ncbi:hypothetical protein N7G274_003329 [Stereocaulon virgatum]|uniref:Uncharacterized protein n=1 Tax=Stereocaulon virgatum TaxID=373712 RepID=A0ABR4AEE0_9LECA